MSVLTALPPIPNLSGLVYNNLVAGLINEIDLLLGSFVVDNYQKLSDFLSMPLTILATLYIFSMGISMAMGWIIFSIARFTQMAFKIGLIMTLVLQWPVVDEFFIHLIQQLINGLSDTLVIASPYQIPEAENFDEAMQIVLTAFSKIGSIVFESGGLGNLGGYLDGIIIWGVGYLTVGLTLFEIILAKISLSLLFTFTPLIALCLFSKITYPIFDRWLSLIFGMILLQLFVQATSTLCMDLVYAWAAEHSADQAIGIGNYGTLPIIILGLVCIGMIHKAGQIGLLIGSGVAQYSHTGSVIHHYFSKNPQSQSSQKQTSSPKNPNAYPSLPGAL